MNHSSDLKTMEEIFRLPALHNPIPEDETNVTGKGYNTVESVNDLGDLFVPGVIPSTFGAAPANSAGDAKDAKQVAALPAGSGISGAIGRQ